MPKRTDPRYVVSAAQEKSAAKALGAKQHAGSGSGHRMHDMHTADELIECKTVLTGNRQITIKADDLKSLSYQAAVADREPVLHVRLDGKDWVLVSESYYLELKDD
jgi:Holliday junction resolvase